MSLIEISYISALAFFPTCAVLALLVIGIYNWKK
jgi:hypothetical protein